MWKFRIRVGERYETWKSLYDVFEGSEVVQKA